MQKKEDVLYQNTRKFILSKENPYYYQGTCASGIGSPHTPNNYIWHIALIMQGLTGDKEEAKRMINLILKTDNEEGFCYEGFDKDDPSHYMKS